MTSSFKKTVPWIALFMGFWIGCVPPQPPRPDPSYPKPYCIDRKWYQPLPHARGFSQKGIASWYGENFHGNPTSSGQIYDMYAMTAAHKILPLGTWVEVKNLENGKKAKVFINDRGPFVDRRIIDLSYAAAKELDFVDQGTVLVEIHTIDDNLQAKDQSMDKISQTRKDTPSNPLSVQKGYYSVQIGAFLQPDKAERLKLSLANSYKDTHIVTYDDGQNTFYRVRVGKLTTAQTANGLYRQLVKDGYINAFVTFD